MFILCAITGIYRETVNNKIKFIQKCSSVSLFKLKTNLPQFFCLLPQLNQITSSPFGLLSSVFIFETSEHCSELRRPIAGWQRDDISSWREPSKFAWWRNQRYRKKSSFVLQMDRHTCERFAYRARNHHCTGSFFVPSPICCLAWWTNRKVFIGEVQNTHRPFIDDSPAHSRMSSRLSQSNCCRTGGVFFCFFLAFTCERRQAQGERLKTQKYHCGSAG